MALEQIAGPFTLRTVDGTPVTDLSLGGMGLTASASVYDDDVGILAKSSALGGMCIVQLDGTACLRGTPRNGVGFCVDLQNPGEFLIHDALFVDGIREFDKFAGIGTLNALYEEQGLLFTYGMHVRCADRWLQFISNRVESRPLDLSAGFTVECPLTTTISFPGVCGISRTSDPEVLAVFMTTGEILFYDHVAKQQLPQNKYFGHAVQGAWYSIKYDIYAAAKADDTISIYASTPRPASLSAVTAVTPLTRGHVSKVKTRVLGDRSEPCVGELVEWEVTGVGQLLKTQSATDEDGYAWNDVVIPPSTTVGASCTVNASLEY